MADDLALELPATNDALQDCLASIEAYCEGQQVRRDTIMRLLIIVEELFTNSIKHGYRAECDRPVRIRMRAGPPLVFTYEDEAPPFDPTRWDTERVLALDPDDRVVGQTGIALVVGMSRSVRYQALPVGNQLVIELA